MTVKINGRTYYRTSEVCHVVGISRSTFFRWLREGSFKDASTVDRRGWRLFTEAELENLKAEVNKVSPNISNSGKN